MKHLVFSLLVTAIVLFALVIPVSADPSNVFVSPFSGGEVYITEGDTVTLRWGWAVMNRGLVKMFLQRQETSFILTGSDSYELVVGSNEASSYYGPIDPFEIPDEWNCPAKKDGAVTYWQYELPNLEVGDYTLVYTLTLDPQITDPCDIDADGHPDVYNDFEISTIIHVAPAED